MTSSRTDDLRNIGGFITATGRIDDRPTEVILTEKRTAALRVAEMVFAANGDDKEQLRELLQELNLYNDLRVSA